MVFVALLVAGMLCVRLAGGRFVMLSEIQIRAAWLVVSALVLQIVTISVLVHPTQALAASLHLLSYALAAAFLWINRRLRGLPLIAAGAALNALAIAANDGTMPASASALRTAGISGDGVHFANSTTVIGPRLALLGDVFALPRSLGAFANVFSVGDVVLTIGAVWFLHGAAGCGWATAHWRPWRSAAET